MLGLTTLGVVHTAISLGALVRDKEIASRNVFGKLHVWMMVLTCLTGFLIMKHGGFDKPHALGVVTLLELVGAAPAGKAKLGRASRYVEVVGYSATFFFHWITTVVETTTSLPFGAVLQIRRMRRAASRLIHWRRCEGKLIPIPSPPAWTYEWPYFCGVCCSL